jgi:hypothetical protein
MANIQKHQSARRRLLSVFGARKRLGRNRGKNLLIGMAVLAAAILLARPVPAQSAPHVTGVEPTSGKVNENVTVTGESLGKGTVSAVYLSDDKSDYKATLVEQAADKIVVKVPQVKAGNYNVSIQVGNSIYIQPVRFEVQE